IFGTGQEVTRQFRRRRLPNSTSRIPVCYSIHLLPSPIAQRQSTRLLVEGLLVRIQSGERVSRVYQDGAFVLLKILSPSLVSRSLQGYAATPEWTEWWRARNSIYAVQPLLSQNFWAGSLRILRIGLWSLFVQSGD